MEGTAYVPLVQRAWELFRKLEADTGVSLLQTTGNLTIGPADGAAVSGFLQSAAAYRIPHELLTATEVNRRWPTLAVPDTFVAGLETEAGILRPERAVEVMLAEATAAGAEIRRSDRVSSVDAVESGVLVTAASGRYRAEVAVVATGARPLAIPKHVRLEAPTRRRVWGPRLQVRPRAWRSSRGPCIGPAAGLRCITVYSGRAGNRTVKTGYGSRWRSRRPSSWETKPTTSLSPMESGFSMLTADGNRRPLFVRTSR